MPLYSFKCECGIEKDAQRRIAERDDPLLCECGKEMKRMITKFSPDIWKPDWFEHIAPDPIFIETKKQLKEECKKHGCIATGYL